MAAACGSLAPPGAAQLFSSPCPSRSRRTHNLPNCFRVVANLVFYMGNPTLSARASPHRSGAGFVLMIGVAGKSYTLADFSLLIGAKLLNEPMMVVEMETFRANLSNCG
jgi:hypothetical protein